MKLTDLLLMQERFIPKARQKPMQAVITVKGKNGQYTFQTATGNLLLHGEIVGKVKERDDGYVYSYHPDGDELEAVTTDEIGSDPKSRAQWLIHALEEY